MVRMHTLTQYPLLLFLISLGSTQQYFKLISILSDVHYMDSIALMRDAVLALMSNWSIHF